MSLSPDFLLRDRYRIETRLASGGMGAVYIALDQTLHLRVAVKENHSPHLDSERQFLREAKLLASLRHSNLPRVTDHFVLGNNQYLVMDFIEGDDLEQIILDNPPRPEEVLQWAAGICDALAYLHSRP
ncbi:MAG: protein kinase, partial [Phycisphaerae bacterium]|nr:protein kinase [Phycisphaerae bacterium]